MSKKYKYHFLYKVINLLSEKYYIGIHSTNNLKDGYMGSGVKIRESIKYYGRKKHKIEILEFFDNRVDLLERESIVVNEELINDELCMNLIPGGLGNGGGFKDFDHMMKCSKAGNDAYLHRLHNDEDFRNMISEKATTNNLRLHKEGKLKTWKDNYDWTGRSHSESTKIKMSESKKGKGVGEENSQYGTCWITKDGINKKIKKDLLFSYEIDGWEKGRKVN